ncbi:MAG: HD domain-containing protein, partial [Anaerolineae bacterium]
MNVLLKGLVHTGDLAEDMVHYLSHHGKARIAAHCLAVGEEARALAARWDADVGQAAVAGWLHDVSAVVPNEQRLGLADAWALEVLPEEVKCPMILHQKLSAA